MSYVDFEYRSDPPMHKFIKEIEEFNKIFQIRNEIVNSLINKKVPEYQVDNLNSILEYTDSMVYDAYINLKKKTKPILEKPRIINNESIVYFGEHIQQTKEL